METGISSFSLLAGVCDAIVALFTRESLCATRIFLTNCTVLGPLLPVLAVLPFVFLLFLVLLLPGRGPHSWLGGVRSSSPAWIDVDAIIGDGPGFFCSMVTGLQDNQHVEQKKKACPRGQHNHSHKWQGWCVASSLSQNLCGGCLALAVPPEGFIHCLDGEFPRQ